MPELVNRNRPNQPHVGHLIRRAQQIHNRYWSARVSEEVTSPQLVLLLALERHPDVDQRTIGEAVSLDRSTTADIVERMIRRGFISRSRDPRDQRRNILQLTTGGRALLDDLAPRTIEMNDRLLELLPPGDREEFVRLLYAFIAAADEASADSPAEASATT
jgi:DNA-binding MarR family transcriptional regulator